MVRVVANLRRWNVTIGGRIEGITDDKEFPALFESALTSDSEVKIVKLIQPTFPHTTSAVIRISAANKETAEAHGQVILLRNLRTIARENFEDKDFGWTIRVSAKAITTQQTLLHWLRHWQRRSSEIV